MRTHNVVYLMAIIFIFSVMPVRADCPTPAPPTETLPPLYGAEAEIRLSVLRVIVPTQAFVCPQMACAGIEPLPVGARVWIMAILWGLDEAGQLSRWYRIDYKGRVAFVPEAHIEARMKDGEMRV